MNLANKSHKSQAVGGFAVLCVTTPPSGLDRVEAAPMRGFGVGVNRPMTGNTTIHVTVR